MRHLVRAILVAALAFGCSSSGGDGGSSNDGTDGTDGTSATDGTSGTDGTSATDGTDGTDGTCTPDCTGKVCGDDGCGGTCGSCGDGQECKSTGQCGVIGCDPFCVNKTCGDDGCGGSCGQCAAGETCNAQGTCDPPCQPQCTGKDCGDDGCGGSCGSCSGTLVCSNAGTCIEPGDIECSTPAEGQPDGGCTSGEACECLGCADDGGCTLQDDCLCPECLTDSYCGDAANCNGDGNCDPYNEGCACSDCAGHTNCVCAPDCDGKTCGPDGCGGTCGDCESGQFCDGGACEACTCDGKVCGDDGCGTSCGECTGASELCSSTGQCVDTSAANCDQATAPETGCTESNPCLCLGCSNDGTCDPNGDDCVCPDCTNDTFCAENQGCNSDGTCDPWSEGCNCPDCVTHPVCPVCEPACDGKTCGDDGCGGTCGTCEGSTFCNEAQQCEACTCDGKTCGDDGCGTSCGTCESGSVCGDDNQCAAVTEGDACVNPLAVGTLPFATTADNTTMSDFSFTDGSCGNGDQGGAGANFNDIVWSFTPDAAGVYSLAVSPTTEGGGFPTSISVYTECTDTGGQTGCTGTSGDLYNDGVGGSWAVGLEAGTTYFIVVDGLFSEDVGEFNFSVSEPCTPLCDGKNCGDDGCGSTCGTCGDGELCNDTQMCADASTVAGNTCALARAVTAGASIEGDTVNATDEYNVGDGVCGDLSPFGTDIADNFFTFTPDTAGVYTFSITASFNVGYTIYSGSCDALTCMAAELNGAEQSLELEAGTTYYVIVDGWTDIFGGASAGTFTLSVSDVCLPQCEGKTCGSNGCAIGTCGECAEGTACDTTQNCSDPTQLAGATCDNPFAIESLPFSSEGDNTGTYDIYTANGCGGFGAGGTDQAYSFTPSTDGVYNVTLTVADGEDAPNVGFAVTSDCGFGEDTCVDFGGPGTQPVELTGGTTYYVIVDSASLDTAGAYTLAMDACTPNCEGKNCGDNGCLGTCGECEGDTVCIEDAEAGTGECKAPTCEGACGDQSQFGCYCDDICFGEGDCCADVCDFCADQAPSEPCTFP